MMLVGQRILIGLMLVSVVVLASPAGAENISRNCGLFEEFVNYRTWLSTYPDYESIKKRLDVSEFQEMAKNTLPEKNWTQKLVSNEDSILLRMEVLIWRSVWVDSRIKEVVNWGEVCDNRLGELFIYKKTGGSPPQIEILRFIKKEGSWLRGSVHFGTTSSLLGKPVKDIVVVN